MIDTLERSSSSEQDEETRRNKLTTSERDDKRHHHHRHRSLERQQHQPQNQQLMQQQGRLPQRGSVSSLFGTSGPRPERENGDEESTITAHTRRNVNNAPRLLPLPPTGPSQFLLLGFCKWSLTFF